MRRKITFTLKLKEVLKEKGMTQRELSEITGIREGTISEMSSNARRTINKQCLAKVMIALDLTDIDQIVETTIEDTYS